MILTCAFCHQPGPPFHAPPDCSAWKPKKKPEPPLPEDLLRSRGNARLDARGK